MYNCGLGHCRSKIGAFNSKEFIPILTQIFHQTKNVKNSLESRGHDIIFLPPYFHFLNPIEHLFSKWKSIEKADMIIFNSRDFNKVMQRASLQIAIENCQRWIRESTRFISMTLKN
ncbi:hypothetical protein RF11_14024 [Thelohanellus kitauei]|uniref:Tc1-like transposase DDE domain-containing protein n=1 Tax=Thelohanellus kitauei TaxID=669202 RepID=A0A0C2J0R7_THEKT|nr:hypothetical protein RF11_14024 [Thelohanellus kitauei]